MYFRRRATRPELHLFGLRPVFFLSRLWPRGSPNLVNLLQNRSFIQRIELARITPKIPAECPQDPSLP